MLVGIIPWHHLMTDDPLKVVAMKVLLYKKDVNVVGFECDLVSSETPQQI